MKYLIDTDIIVYHLRHKKEIPDDVYSSDPTVSIISYGELLYGAYKSQQRETALQAIDIFFASRLPLILPITGEIIHSFAKTKAYLEMHGRRLDDLDLLIAATALVHDLTLVTNNKKHFERIPKLKIYS